MAMGGLRRMSLSAIRSVKFCELKFGADSLVAEHNDSPPESMLNHDYEHDKHNWF